MQTRTLRAGAAVVALTATLGAACGGDVPRARIHTAQGGTVEVILEVVDTPDARARGLMYRTELADGHGMLFVFPRDEDHRFWMKNTLISLDMLFIDRDGTLVGIHPNAVPLSAAAVGVGRPSRYVLEVPGGWAARRAVAVGDRVELVDVAVP